MYDTVASMYDNIYAKKNYALEAHQIKNLMHERDLSKSLLDVGCGTGNHARFFVSWIHYTGIDISPKMIETAVKKEISGTKFIHASLNETDNEQYDVVVSLFNVINHVHNISDILEFFRNAYRVSSPRSSFIFDVWNGLAAIIDPPRPEQRFINGLEIKIDPVFSGFDQAVTINYVTSRDGNIVWSDSLKMTLWTPKVLVDCLKRVGYEVNEIYTGFGKESGLSPAIPDDYKILFYCKKKEL